MISSRASEIVKLSVIIIILRLTVDGQCLHIVFVNYKMKLGAANASLHFCKANSMGLFAIYIYPDLVNFLVPVKLCRTTSDKILFGFDGWLLVCFGFNCFGFLGREDKSSMLSESLERL